MEITIQQAKPTADGTSAITFSSPLGNAFGSWPGTPPAPGQTYRVELSVGGPLTWNSDIKVSAEQAYRIGSAGERVVLHALLESVEEAGLVFLRLDNTLLMVDTVGSPPPVGTFVEAHIQDLTLTDTNL